MRRPVVRAHLEKVGEALDWHGALSIDYIMPDDGDAALPEGREGVLTHLAMQALLGCGARGGTRRDIARECWRLFANSGAYAGSAEELTPVEADWISAVPLAMTAALLLASPQSTIKLARGGFGAHLLDLRSIQMIEGEDFGQT